MTLGRTEAYAAFGNRLAASDCIAAPWTVEGPREAALRRVERTADTTMAAASITNPITSPSANGITWRSAGTDAA